MIVKLWSGVLLTQGLDQVLVHGVDEGNLWAATLMRYRIVSEIADDVCIFKYCACVRPSARKQCLSNTYSQEILNTLGSLLLQ